MKKSGFVNFCNNCSKLKTAVSVKSYSQLPDEDLKVVCVLHLSNEFDKI